MNDLNPIHAFKRIELSVQKFGSQMSIAPSCLEVQQDIDYVAKQLVQTLYMKIYGRELERIEVKYPADWIQAFKERWFPASILKKFPVRYTTKTITATELYPQISVKDQQHTIVLKEDC